MNSPPVLVGIQMRIITLQTVWNTQKAASLLTYVWPNKNVFIAILFIVAPSQK